MSNIRILLLFLIPLYLSANAQSATGRKTINFNKDWKFSLGDSPNASNFSFTDVNWERLNLPHDWSIFGKFSKDHPATPGGGALPGGIGWYRKTFTIQSADKGKSVFIDFDGVYRYSKVWINGHLLGSRPNGYIPFRYDLTPYLRIGQKNVIAVRVDNSKQPNSRWYSGSGIYRDVKLVVTGEVFVDQWGTQVKTKSLTTDNASVGLTISIKNKHTQANTIVVKSAIVATDGKIVADASNRLNVKQKAEITQVFSINNPILWSVERPFLYKIETQLIVGNKIVDSYTTPLGLRYFHFDAEKGFFLNGKSLKIKGVCNHHDLGALGAAFNRRAAERQLELLREMGCNAIRTTHNPPAEELLNLCDQMGFLVMDEAFDMWKISKNKYDYSVNWDQWHARDLKDQIKRDRNHPSIIIWSVGNEIMEQWGGDKDTTGRAITRELVSIVRSLDDRPITTGNNAIEKNNNLIKPNALDIIGYNYSHDKFGDFHKLFPGQTFIATETTSALQTRGHYDLPSDSIRIWPEKWDKPLVDGNKDLTCSAYDNCRTPWGSSHEDALKVMTQYPHVSGIFVWTGFDYLGEPTPYTWPARSSYFGIIDLAGIPKDVYYMYKSQWSNKPVLHVFPHWNWKEGQEVDIWAYFSQADEVELFLNGKSLGVRRMPENTYHVVWRVPFKTGILKAISRKAGKEVLTQEISTAGAAHKITLMPDRFNLQANEDDLSYVTVNIEDDQGTLVPDASNLVKFTLEGPGKIIGVDNGNPTSMESFKKPFRKAFYGKAMVIIQSKKNKGTIKLIAESEGLKMGEVSLLVK